MKHVTVCSNFGGGNRRAILMNGDNSVRLMEGAICENGGGSVHFLCTGALAVIGTCHKCHIEVIDSIIGAGCDHDHRPHHDPCGLILPVAIANSGSAHNLNQLCQN